MIHQEIFSLSRAIEIFRHYRHLRTDILQKTVVRGEAGESSRAIEVPRFTATGRDDTSQRQI